MTKRTTQQLRRLKRLKRLKEMKELAVVEADYCCLYCGRHMSSTNLTVHHVVPLSQGGTDELENLCPTCWQRGCKAHDRLHGLIKDKPLYVKWDGTEFVFSEVKL